MSKFLKTVGIVGLVAVVTVAGLGAAAYFWPAAAAQGQSVVAHDGGPGGWGGPLGQAGLEAAAQKLGMTVDELTTRLRSGDSLSDLATEAGVDLQDVQDAITAADKAATRDAIEQAVTDGTITREHADWLLEGLDKGFWGPGTDGFGFGRHGPGGFGGIGGPHDFGQRPGNGNAQPTSTPGSTT